MSEKDNVGPQATPPALPQGWRLERGVWKSSYGPSPYIAVIEEATGRQKNVYSSEQIFYAFLEALMEQTKEMRDE